MKPFVFFFSFWFFSIFYLLRDDGIMGMSISLLLLSCFDGMFSLGFVPSLIAISV
uniref:Uncharacterized protein n=1 Tax=Rhizophora mucronata TaxID=61149 RepID=A0A2P2P613_RHIMU